MPIQPPAPNRRRTFSLRTLFVVVTLLAVWLAYEWNWIRQRRELISSRRVLVSETVHAPGLLWLLGEQGHKDALLLIWNCHNPTAEDEADIARAVKLFPEASVQYMSGRDE